MKQGATKERQHGAECECAACAAEHEEAASSSAHGALQRGGAKKESRPGVRKFRSLCSLAEAVSVDRVKREVRCMVIREGAGNKRDRHFYGPEAIRDIARVIEGAQSYINHPTARQQQERPEGDVRELCGYWKDAAIVEGADGKKGVMATLCCDRSPAGDEALAKAEHAIQYAKEFPDLQEVYAGLSINGDGETEPRDMTIDGEDVEMLYVIAVTECGADVVTRPAREGRFLGLLESMRNATDPKEAKSMLKKMIRESLAKIDATKKQLAEEKIEAAEAEKIIAAEQGKIAAAVAESKDGKGDGKKQRTSEAESEEDTEESEEDETEESEDEDESMRAAGEDDDGYEDDEEQPDGGNAGDGKKKGGRVTHTIKHEERMTKTESKATIRDLRKQLAESEKARKALAARAVAAEVKALTESGMPEKLARAIVALPKDQRQAIEGVVGMINESAPFGGPTMRGTVIRESNPGEAFVKLLGNA